MQDDGLALRSFRTITGLFLIVWLVLPMVPLAVWSFAHGWFFPNLLPTNWSLKAWQYALSDTAGVLDSLWLTIFISATVSFLSVLVGLPAGRALGLHRFRGKNIVELLILAPMIVPGIAVVMGIHSVFIVIGLHNTVAGVILVHMVPTLPYTILIVASVFENFDTDFEAQARSLGASGFDTLRHVTLPAIMPGVVAAGLFAFLVSWSQYILTLMIGGGKIVTLPLLLFNFASAGRHDIAGAIGLIYIIPGVFILLLNARYLSGQAGAGRGIFKT